MSVFLVHVQTACNVNPPGTSPHHQHRGHLGLLLYPCIWLSGVTPTCNLIKAIPGGNSCKPLHAHAPCWSGIPSLNWYSSWRNGGKRSFSKPPLNAVSPTHSLTDSRGHWGQGTFISKTLIGCLHNMPNYIWASPQPFLPLCLNFKEPKTTLKWPWNATLEM